MLLNVQQTEDYFSCKNLLSMLLTDQIKLPVWLRPLSPAGMLGPIVAVLSYIH